MKGRIRRGSRIQEGIHHIILRKENTVCDASEAGVAVLSSSSSEGNRDKCGLSVGINREWQTRLLFVCDEDKVLFLSLVNQLAKRFHALIFAFVLMDTHVHLLVRSKVISLFIGTLCSRYARVYHKKYATKGVLFRRAFVSIVKDYELWQLDTILYILNNPLEAGMCHRHIDYFYSSYRQHMGIRTSLDEVISIDNLLINKYFKTRSEFKEALNAKLCYQKKVAHVKYGGK